MNVSRKRGRRRRGRGKLEEMTSNVSDFGIKPRGSRRKNVRRKDAGKISQGVDGGVAKEMVCVLKGKSFMFEKFEGAREGGGDFTKCPITCISTI